MSANLARKGRSDKPPKPRPDWPLTANGNGQWSKKIRGRVYYFGPWADPDGALDRYLDQRDDLMAGRTPKPKGGFTVMDLCNHYLTAKKQLLNEGAITVKTFHEYNRLTDRIMGFFHRNRLVSDVGPTDFQGFRVKLAEDLSPVTMKKTITLVESVFNFAFNNGHIDVPVRFGSEFRGPSRRILRLERKKKPSRSFTAPEIRKMLKATEGPLRAMILLGINGGYGNSDCSTLPRAVVDLEGGWIDFHRIKTGIDRRTPLWPETREALKAAIKSRPNPRDPEDGGLVFLTKYGQPWVRGKMSDKTEGKHVAIDSLAQEIRKLMKSLGMNGGRNFYALRHTFETVGGESKDQVAVNALMGHVDDSMAGVYRESISDDRLRAVVDHVHAWLYPRPTVEGGAK